MTCDTDDTGTTSFDVVLNICVFISQALGNTALLGCAVAPIVMDRVMNR